MTGDFQSPCRCVYIFCSNCIFIEDAIAAHQHGKTMSDSLPVGDEPAAKRNRTDDENNINIFNWLNRDCLQSVFDNLPTGELLRTMEVSQQWREEVVEYLRGARFCFEFYYVPRTYFIPRLVGLISPEELHERTMPFEMCQGALSQFEVKLKELGPSVVSVALDCLNDASLKTITQYCPDLKDLMIVGLQAEHSEHDPPNPYQEPWNAQEPVRNCSLLSFNAEVLQCLQSLKLKRISFVHSPIIVENTIGEFLKSDTLEEVIISRNKLVNGCCLSNLQSPNLKSLRLIGCSLSLVRLMPIVDRLTNLTMLELSNNPAEILQGVHTFLDKLPNLEHLILNSYPKMDLSSGIVESMRRLGRLKHLSLCWNDNVCDEWLVAVAAGSPLLETLDIECRREGEERQRHLHPRGEVSARGVLALCRGAPRLRHLGLGARAAAAAQLPACVACCPDLESVDLRGCQLTPELLAATAEAARGRRKALRLHVARTTVRRYDQVPEGITYSFVDLPKIFRLV